MGLILTMSFFFIIVTVIFVAIAIFLPEWMGITGNHARRIIAEQQEKKTEEEEKKDENAP